MFKNLLIMFFFISSLISCKTIEKKKYENSSSLLERKSESDLFSPSISRKKFDEKRLNNDLFIKGKISFEGKEEFLILTCVEELNQGKYQSVIDKLNSYINTEQKNKSWVVEQELERKPLRDIYLILALAYFESGDESHALPLFDKLIYYADKWEPVYLALCEFYLKKNAYSLVKTVALKGIDKISNPSADIYLYYARAAIGLNSLELAEKIIEKTKIFYPQNADVFAWSGLMDLKSKNIVEGCKKIKESYFLNKQNPFSAYNHAACLIQSGDFDGAQSVLQLGISSFPSYPDFYYLSGVLKMKQEKRLEAQKYWENYIKLSDLSDPRLPYVKASLSGIGPGH